MARGGGLKTTMLTRDHVATHYRRLDAAAHETFVSTGSCASGPRRAIEASFGLTVATDFAL